MKRIRGLLVLLLCLTMAACKADQDKPVWGVYYPGLPEKIQVALANDDAVFYILKQTHETVLRKEDGQNYSSRILSKWDRSTDSAKFGFCLKPGLKFNEREPFSAEMFASHMSGIARKYGGVPGLRHADGCVSISFSKPSPGFMEYLTKYENAPTKAIAENIEIGLGPFLIQGLSREHVLLKRKSYRADGYNSVVMYEYGGKTDLAIPGRAVSDYNRIPEREVPPEVKRSQVSFTNITLKSVSLIVNVQDKAFRRRIYNCIDPIELRAAFFPEAKGFYDIQTVLPLGVPGAKSGQAMQSCRKDTAPSSPSRTLVLANWRTDNKETLRRFTAKLYKKSGIQIVVRDYQAYDLVKTLFKRPHPYDLHMIATIVLTPEYEVFFKNILGNSEVLMDYDLPQLKTLYNKMLKAEDIQEKQDLAVRIAEGLSDEGAVLPLYQETRIFYYPSEIKNIIAGKSFVEYPEIAEFRL